MTTRLLPIFAMPLLLLAAAPAAPAPDELIRQANAAFLRGDAVAADALYAAAEERTGDPGLVAFNKAAGLFQKGDFYSAEVHYARTLDDKACPPDRAARSWFNRGTCLVRRGGSASVYRSAIACFEHSLDSPVADEPLKADARHNLELAKLLWIEANKKAAKPDNPNAAPPEDEKPEATPQGGGVEPDKIDPKRPDGRPHAKDPRPLTAVDPGASPKGPPPKDATTQQAANNRNLQPLEDSDQAKPLSPEDTREYLRRTELRLREERRNMQRALYGPDRPGVRDW